MKKILLITVICISGMKGFTQVQDPFAALPSPLIGKEMPEFSLISHEAKYISLEKTDAKATVIFFLRGLAEEGRWCQICHYQYADMVRLALKLDLKAKGIECLFVLPYSQDSVKLWTRVFPEQYEIIKSWKYPDDDTNPSMMAWSEISGYIMPYDLWEEQTEPPLIFPVLSDPGGRYAQKIGLRTTLWGGKAVLQNIPTVFVLDHQNRLRYKYHSQNLYDRPPNEMILSFISLVLNENF